MSPEHVGDEPDLEHAFGAIVHDAERELQSTSMPMPGPERQFGRECVDG